MIRRVAWPILLALWLGPAAAAPGGDFALTDHDGNPFRLEQLRGKVVLLLFGYTSCPDVCPTGLAAMAQVLDGLGPARERVRGLFVTLDPARDTLARLRRYVRYFDPAITGLSGSEQEIDVVARRYRVRYRRMESLGENYPVDHSANLYLIDADGRLAAIVPHGMPAAHTLGLVRRLLAGEGGDDGG